MQKPKFYVTTPIYYANSKPHIGHLYSTLLADVIARFHKLQNHEVFFATGLDEHGQKIAQAAQAANMQPQAFVDSMVPRFTAVWQEFGINYNKFIRTTDSDHKQAVQSLISQLIAKDLIYKSSYQGFYCTPCETFINPQEVKQQNNEVLCTTCARATKEISEESYFFRLSAFEQPLLEFYANNPEFIQPKERLNEVISFVKSGLKDLSFSRKSVTWGIPFPGDPSHSVYVWGDALTNYLSAIGFNHEMQTFTKFWPADLHILAKDILRFHAVYWPAMLMAAELPLPKRELVHGYILQDNAKMSKSVGNVIDPLELANLYGAEQVRYYLTRMIPTTQDSSFSLSEIEDCIRADLANNLGNLLSRVCTLATKNSCATLSAPEFAGLHPDCQQLLTELTTGIEKIKSDFNALLMHHATAEICKQLSNANALIHKLEPWKLVKTDFELFQAVLWSAMCVLKVAGIFLTPIMPQKMQQLLNALGVTLSTNDNNLQSLSDNILRSNFTITPLAEVLFARPVETPKAEASAPTSCPSSEIAAAPATNFADITDLAKIQLSIGKIVAAEKLEKSDKLLKLQVDFGIHGMRQVVSGIAQHYKPEEVLGQNAVFVINLQPRKIMGLESQAMILCASNDDKSKLSFLTPQQEILPGAKIS